MQVRVKIDSAYKEAQVIVLTASMTEEVNEIIRKLSWENIKMLPGYKEGKMELIDPAEVVRIYALSGKVYAVTSKGEYLLKMRIYEIEMKLDSERFVRISNSEIINLKQTENFDLNMTGTICVRMLNGDITYVSRRYTARLKKVLGI